MTIGNHIKSGKDLEQEKPAVYREYSDRDGLRDFKRIKIDIPDGSRSDLKRAGIFKMYEIEGISVKSFLMLKAKKKLCFTQKKVHKTTLFRSYL